MGGALAPPFFFLFWVVAFSLRGGESVEFVPKGREALRDAVRIQDVDPGDPEPGQGEAHRHPVIPVRFDLRPTQTPRADLQQVRFLPCLCASLRASRAIAATRSVSLIRRAPSPLSLLRPS